MQAIRKFDFTTIWPQVQDFAGVDAIRVEGLEHLDDALGRGKGAILVSAHFGFFRMIKPVLNSDGRHVRLVAKLARSPMPDGHPNSQAPRLTRAGRLVRELRLPRVRSDERWDQIGGDIPPGLNLRPCLEVLRRNEALLILADGRKGESALHTLTVAGVEVPFASGAMSIARSTGAPVLPTFVVDDPGRSGPASLRLIVHPELRLQITDDPGADLDENLRRFVGVYEEQIRAYPHNFLWNRVRNGVFVRSHDRLC